jgi:NitT/TauT family transport system substrate-binding protein
MNTQNALRFLFILLFPVWTAGPAYSQVKEITIADQFGFAFLPLAVMQEQRLIEKHIKAAGLGEVKVKWAKFGGAGMMNDALLAESVQFATIGTPGLLFIWDKTRGSKNEVKGISSISNAAMYLNTRNPEIKTLRDFTDQDKIALPAVKSSYQAIALQMAAAKEFGIKDFARLDKLTVSMKHPDAMASLLSGKGELNSHFASPPYNYQELKQGSIRRILSTRDVIGDTSFVVSYTTSKFRDANPILVAAFLAATQEAVNFIASDKKTAAAIYLKMSNGRTEDLPALLEMLNNPDTDFSTTPKGVGKIAAFMKEVGTMKNAPASWKDFFFSTIHSADGS